MKDICSQMLMELMQNIPDSVYFKDREGKFVMVSKVKADNSLTTCEEMVGRTDFDFLPEEEAQQSFDDEQEIIKTGKPLRDKIEKLTRLDGKEVWVSVSKTPWRDESGHIIGIIGISRDITKRIEIEKNILDMMAIATHEIRGPLASIGMTIRLITRGSYGVIDESVKATLEELLQRILRLENVVNDYLGKSSFLNLKTGVPKKEKLDLREDIIDPLLEELSPEIQENEITIDNKLGGIPGGHRIMIDAHKAWLKMVFRILIRNGIKHGGKGGIIAIGYEDWEEKFAFVVFNNGPSVEPEEREKIFEKFYSSKGSTGLGLYLGRKLIRKHGGDMWYEDTLDGHPKFIFTLPKAD